VVRKLLYDVPDGELQMRLPLSVKIIADPAVTSVGVRNIKPDARGSPDLETLNTWGMNGSVTKAVAAAMPSAKAQKMPRWIYILKKRDDEMRIRNG